MPKTNIENKIFTECEVLESYDDAMGMRIKVKMHDADAYRTDDEIPYCFPLLPKMFQVLPKKGERVLVTNSNFSDHDSRRWYIGPIISQPYFMNYDPFYFSSKALLDEGDSQVKPLPDPRRNPDNDGTLPEPEDIVVNGRNNADLILKENEVRLRCGFKKYPNLPESLSFTKSTPAYIQMKYKQRYDNNDTPYDTSINVVADRINLLSPHSPNYFKFTDPENHDLITDEELNNIIDNAHPLPYGDNLIEYLKQLVWVFQTHTHPMAMDPPALSKPQTDKLNTDQLNKMLSRSVRIN